MGWKDKEKERAFREKNRERYAAMQRERRRIKRGLVLREVRCVICGEVFTTARKDQVTCGAKACRLARQRRLYFVHGIDVRQAERRAAERMRACGVTLEEAAAVVAAQDSDDRERLWRESQAWTDGQRKFAIKRYREIYGF